MKVPYLFTIPFKINIKFVDEMRILFPFDYPSLIEFIKDMEDECNKTPTRKFRLMSQSEFYKHRELYHFIPCLTPVRVTELYMNFDKLKEAFNIPWHYYIDGPEKYISYSDDTLEEFIADTYYVAESKDAYDDGYITGEIHLDSFGMEFAEERETIYYIWEEQYISNTGLSTEMLIAYIHDSINKNHSGYGIWYSVKDKLPKEGEFVIGLYVVNNTPIFNFCTFQNGKFYAFGIIDTLGKCMYWTPLPSLPKNLPGIPENSIEIKSNKNVYGYEFNKYPELIKNNKKIIWE